MTDDGVRLTLLWVILTAIGEFIVLGWSMLPEGFSVEADVVDEAYLILLVLAVPVFAFVVAMLIFSAIRFRTKDGPDEDGPPLKAKPSIVRGWLAITSLLAVGILINPGFVGLSDIRGSSAADMVIDVQSQRWFWSITYPNGGVSTEELVVPVDTRIRFDITSLDVLHSFWVPAFRAKIDAVPGRTTELFVSVDREGLFENDSNLRVQCAEFCGLGHASMAIPVRVLDGAAFDGWMGELIEEGA